MEEAIAFLKGSRGQAAQSLYLFTQDGDYHLTDVIEGDGTSFASVEYVQLTDRPGIELVIGWQLSTDVLQSLGAYSYADGHVSELMNANYSEYRVADLDSDGQKDIFISALTQSSRRALQSSITGRTGSWNANGSVSDCWSIPSQAHFEWESDEGHSRRLCVERI